MMSTGKSCYFVGILLQISLISYAKPLGLGYGDPYFQPPLDFDYGCAPPPAIVPVPQPIPVRIPQPQRCQSVTIPNIILALLPPNNRPVLPKPTIRPPPAGLPLPQPLPLPVPTEYDGLGGPDGFGGYSGLGGLGGFGGYGGLGGLGGLGCFGGSGVLEGFDGF